MYLFVYMNDEQSYNFTIKKKRIITTGVGYTMLLIKYGFDEMVVMTPFEKLQDAIHFT